VRRIFTAKAYGQYQLLKRQLLSEGYAEPDIELRLQHVHDLIETFRETGTGTDSNPDRRVFDYFGYDLVCDIHWSEDLFRLIRFRLRA
jgi:hypothetical protein